MNIPFALLWSSLYVLPLFAHNNNLPGALKLLGMDKFDKVRLNGRNYERVKNMHINWYAAGIKALIGKMGSDLYRKMDKDEQRPLAQCLDQIEDKRDLVQSANCLVDARRAFLRKIGVQKLNSANREEINTKNLTPRLMKKREILEPKLRQNGNPRPMQKSDFIAWKERLGRIRKGKSQKNDENKQSKWALDRTDLRPKFQIRQASRINRLASETDRSAIIRVSNLISKFAQQNNNNGTDEGAGAVGAKWTKMYDSLVRLKRANDKRRESPGACVYEKRMYDLVLDRKEPSLGPESKMGPAGLLQMGISLLNKLRNDSAQNGGSNVKFMSPRFAPLMPDKTETANGAKSVLSPTVFALYETTESENGQNGTTSARNKHRTAKAKGLEIASIPEVC